MPEARLNLAEAAIYLARAPKSNSVIVSLGLATEDARSSDPVPRHLRDAHYPAAKGLGHGKGYRYPHDYPGHRVEQEYRPARFEGRRYYEPSGEGEEAIEDEPASDQPTGAASSRSLLASLRGTSTRRGPPAAAGYDAASRAPER